MHPTTLQVLSFKITMTIYPSWTFITKEHSWPEWSSGILLQEGKLEVPSLSSFSRILKKWQKTKANSLRSDLLILAMQLLLCLPGNLEGFLCFLFRGKIHFHNNFKIKQRFSNRIQNVLIVKDKWDHIEIKKFYLKTASRKLKCKSEMKEDICSMYFVKGSIFMVCKAFLKSIFKKANKPIDKWAKYSNRYIAKENVNSQQA